MSASSEELKQVVERENSLRAHMPTFALNTTDEAIRANIRANIRRQLPQVKPHERQDTELLLLGGGWSLPGQIFEIRELYDNGAHVVTMNGTHKWAIDHNLNPSAHVQLDARSFNSRFLEKTIPSCKYLLASQCHPDSFEMLTERNKTFIWHAATTHGVERGLLDDYYKKHWVPIIGGSTVMLRTLTLFHMMGFTNFHAFGFDSCLHPSEKIHHAYPQRENDRADVIQYDHGGKTWTCQTWMASQALDFLNQRKAIGKDWNLRVHGNGLIAHLLNQKDEG